MSDDATNRSRDQHEGPHDDGAHGDGAHGDGVRGGIFDPSLPDGRGVATLSVRDGALYAEVAGQAEPLALPLSRLALEVGGADGDVIFCRHEAAPGRCIHGRGAAMRDLLTPHLGAEQLAAITTLRTRPRSLWPGLLGLSLGLVLALYLLTQMVATVAGWVPFGVDAQIGRAAKPLVLADATGKVVTEAAITDPVRAVMERVVAHSERPELRWDLTIVRSDTVNAFALPGGYVVVYTGLLAKVERPDELAAVLAHEWTHVTQRHGMRKLGQSLGVVLLVDVLIGDIAGIAQSAAELYSMAQVQSYGRELEEQSDAEAVRVLARAGLDPTAVAAFFEALAASSPQTDGGVLDWLSTHPSHQARVDAARALASSAEVRALRPAQPTALDVDWPALRAALRR